MKKTKFTQSEILFLKYSFKGDGKYYTTEKGTMNYKKSDFLKFYERNPDSVIILERGNDAPRGGQTGIFYNVIFTPVFAAKFSPLIQSIEQDKKAQEEAKNKLKNDIEAIGDQSEILKSYFAANPHFKERILERIQNNSNKNWRSWVKMKVCGKLEIDFKFLTLTASEIRDIAATN
jgi:transposase